FKIILNFFKLMILNSKLGKVFKIFGGDRDKYDIVVVDQHQGATLPCDWMEFGKFPFGEEKLEVSIADYFREKGWEEVYICDTTIW
mgnify:CR=1